MLPRIEAKLMSIRFKRRTGLQSAAVRDHVGNLMGSLGIPCFVAQILASRGIGDAESARAFLNPSLKDDWSDPYLISGMEDAISMLEDAIRAGDHIVVFGDFDLDGLSASTVMTRGIRALGGHATPFIPKRFEEGYGITDAAIARMRTLSPDLVVTVDCGISCRREVEQLVSEGMRVVITDHHEASETTPDSPGVPVVDPKAEDGNPAAILAGVGVALKVICALGSRFGFPYLWRSYTDFAALGTVADLMPMLGENRALVADGISRMNIEPRPCIEALVSTCGMAGKELASTNLGFSLAPRLNAAGRMGDAQLALDLLMCDDPEQCMELALGLEELNAQRRRIESELSKEASEKVEAEYAGERVIVVAGEGWHEGVKGIVASRLANKHNVPALLFTICGDEARGSGRSVGGIDLFKAVESASGILTRFGGHSAAVGVTLPADKLGELRERLDSYMASLPKDQFDVMTEYDATVHLDELTIENVELMERLAPFGQQNPAPVLLAKSVLLANCKAVGASKNHLSCSLTDGRAQVAAIQFHCSEIESLSSDERIVDAVFTVQIDEWRGRRNVKAMVETIQPAYSCSALEACLDGDDSSFTEGLFGRACGAGRAAQAVSDDEAAAEGARGDFASDAAASARAEAKLRWKRVAQADPARLRQSIVSAIIGDNLPHDTQSKMMDMLDSGVSVLGVMATGRGKSLVFQVHAAMVALRDGKASLFVYPLRALMSDQAFHLASQFERFGLECRVLNGETSEESRQETYAGLASGDVDIVLTTPEYLSFHADDIAKSSRIGFMVVDEAHHIGQARAGTRPAYRELGEVAAKLGYPVVLAVTATANDRIADDITHVLPIRERVVDLSSRDNLHIDDQRGIANRDDYLAHIVMSSGKCIVYVNSREQSVGVARRLRARIPQLAPMIGFYNAGLGRVERTRVEDLFRRGAIRTLVATSAFGEGIDIPDIRHVVLYHMPFSDVEFNQMAGRGGRDGRHAWIHLLYGRQDVAMNRRILESMTPPRDDLALVYRRLRAMQKMAGDAAMRLDDAELAQRMSEGSRRIELGAIACGLAVFSELGLIQCDDVFEGGSVCHVVRVVEDAGRVELADSLRYREGMDEVSDFMAFRDWAMRCDIHGLTVRVTHPIAPDSNSEEDHGCK